MNVKQIDAEIKKLTIWIAMLCAARSKIKRAALARAKKKRA
ncbi:MAG: hypothetical protein WC829_01000 [Hyphomicrobium sp.]|jgi:hypothetical protein